jgi:hypothetical protein
MCLCLHLLGVSIATVFCLRLLRVFTGCKHTQEMISLCNQQAVSVCMLPTGCGLTARAAQVFCGGIVTVGLNYSSWVSATCEAAEIQQDV